MAVYALLSRACLSLTQPPHSLSLFAPLLLRLRVFLSGSALRCCLFTLGASSAWLLGDFWSPLLLLLLSKTWPSWKRNGIRDRRFGHDFDGHGYGDPGRGKASHGAPCLRVRRGLGSVRQRAD